MKIILKQDLASLGEEGDIKEVADGYARNYLIPRGMASRYTKHAVNELAKRQHIIEKRRADKAKEAASYKVRLEAEELVFHFSAGEKGRLFGAVTSATIADELAKKGISVEKKFIDVPQHSIKEVGTSVVKIRLYGNEVASVKVSVQSMQEEKAAAAAKVD